MNDIILFYVYLLTYHTDIDVVLTILAKINQEHYNNLHLFKITLKQFWHYKNIISMQVLHASLHALNDDDFYLLITHIIFSKLIIYKKISSFDLNDFLLYC